MILTWLKPFLFYVLTRNKVFLVFLVFPVLLSLLILSSLLSHECNLVLEGVDRSRPQLFLSLSLDLKTVSTWVYHSLFSYSLLILFLSIFCLSLWFSQVSFREKRSRDPFESSRQVHKTSHTREQKEIDHESVSRFFWNNRLVFP